MFERVIAQTIQKITTETLQERSVIALTDILQDARIPARLKPFFETEVQWWLYNEALARSANKRFDYDHPELASLLTYIEQVQFRHARFEREEFAAVLDSAVKLIYNYLCRPQTTLKWYIFRGQPVKPLNEVLLRFGAFVDYPYFRTVFTDWVDRKRSERATFDAISATEFERVIRRIDDQILLNCTVEGLLEMMDPMFDFIGEGTEQLVPLDALVILFDDKNIKKLVDQLENYRDRGGEVVGREGFVALLEELLSTADDEPEADFSSVYQNDALDEVVRQHLQARDPVDAYQYDTPPAGGVAASGEWRDGDAAGDEMTSREAAGGETANVEAAGGAVAGDETTSGEVAGNETESAWATSGEVAAGGETASVEATGGGWSGDEVARNDDALVEGGEWQGGEAASSETTGREIESRERRADPPTDPAAAESDALQPLDPLHGADAPVADDSPVVADAPAVDDSPILADAPTADDVHAIDDIPDLDGDALLEIQEVSDIGAVFDDGRYAVESIGDVPVIVEHTGPGEGAVGDGAFDVEQLLDDDDEFDEPFPAFNGTSITASLEAMGNEPQEETASAATDVPAADPVVAAAAPPKPERIAMEDVRRFVDDSLERKVVKKIFGRDRMAYEAALGRLNESVTWRDASQVLNEIFIHYQVDPYSRTAIRFTDSVYGRFLGASR